MPQIRYVRLGRRQVNPFMQVVGMIVGLTVFAVAVIVGGFVLAALIGLALIAWLVIYVRLWWLARKAGHASPAGVTAGAAREDFVDAEYRVIETRDHDDDGAQ